MVEHICEVCGIRPAVYARALPESGFHHQPVPARGGLSHKQAKRATALLTANLKGGIAIDDVAAECGLSPSHFARAFKETIGKPPHRWLIEHRVARAKDLLLTSDLAIVDIAAECGFADQSHLTRQFVNVTGLPPGTWRRHHRD